MASPGGGLHGPALHTPRIVAVIVAVPRSQHETTMRRDAPAGEGTGVGEAAELGASGNGDGGEEEADGAAEPGAGSAELAGVANGDDDAKPAPHDPSVDGTETTSGSRVASISRSMREELPAAIVVVAETLHTSTSVTPRTRK